MSNNPVIDYYHSVESRFGYRLLKGVKHFGYYPAGKEDLPVLEAQMLMNEQLATTLALPAGKRVLDAGCGEGNVSLYLAQRHKMTMEGIDLLDSNIAKANAIAIEQSLEDSVNFQVGTYMNLPFENNSFDAVYTMETLVHAPDYKRALSEFYRVLKPKGKLVLFEYSLKPEIDLTKAEIEPMKRLKQVNRVASMPAFNEFTFGSMSKKLNDAGFKNVTSKEITQRIIPMLKRFYRKARLPYKLFRAMKAENHVINAMSAVEFYENTGLWKYEITTAVAVK